MVVPYLWWWAMTWFSSMGDYAWLPLVGFRRIAGDLSQAVEDSGVSSVVVTSADGEHAASLPPLHQGPFDGMLVAQATRLGAVVVSRNPAIADDGVDVLTAQARDSIAP